MIREGGLDWPVDQKRSVVFKMRGEGVGGDEQPKELDALDDRPGELPTRGEGESGGGGGAGTETGAGAERLER